MKKNFKRLIAIVAAVAMTVTGITFTPATDVSAAQANSCTIGGSDHTVGKWKYNVVQNEWNNCKASYNDATIVDGFIYSQDVYGWDGAYWKVNDLKSVYNLTAGISYSMSISVSAPSNAGSTGTNLNIRTTGGTTNMASTSKTIKSGSNLTYSADVTPSSSALVLAIGYGNNGEGNGSGAQVGGFKINSITFIIVYINFYINIIIILKSSTNFNCRKAYHIFFLSFIFYIHIILLKYL